MVLDDKTVKIVLDGRDLPTYWYNVVSDPARTAVASAYQDRHSGDALVTWR